MQSRKEAYLFAIQNEIKSQNLYRMLAKSFKCKEIATVFERLVPLEQLHEEKLREIFRKEFPDESIPVDPKAIPDFMNHNDIKDPRAIYDFAVERENYAEESYQKLAAQTEQNELKKLFYTLASEEKNHAELIYTEIEKLANTLVCLMSQS